MLRLIDAVAVLLGVVEVVDFGIGNGEIFILERGEVLLCVCDCRCRGVVVEDGFGVKLVGGEHAGELAHELLLEEHLLGVLFECEPSLLVGGSLVGGDASLGGVVGSLPKQLCAGDTHALHHLLHVGVGCFAEQGV